MCTNDYAGGVSVSDLGSLSQCMLENDAESRGRARNLRRKALVISVVFEALLLGAMLLWPLITPACLARSLQRDAHAALPRRRWLRGKTRDAARPSARRSSQQAGPLPLLRKAHSSHADPSIQ